MNKSLSFAGIINSAEIRTSKTGNQYANFELEDFTDSYRLSLFSDDFMRFKYLLVEGTYVLIFARIEANKKNNRPEVRVKNMVLLAEAMEKFCKSISVTVELGKLDSEFIKELAKIVRSNPGECEMNIRVKDAGDGLVLGLHPRKFRINPSGFVHAVSGLEPVEIKLNGFQMNG
jgi:DNA polymerase-3 subunit alpha